MRYDVLEHLYILWIRQFSRCHNNYHQMFFINVQDSRSINTEIARDRKLLRTAFEHCASILGESMKNAMLRELKVRAGINFDDPSLSMSLLHDALSTLYGDSISQMLMESTILKLDEIASSRT